MTLLYTDPTFLLHETGAHVEVPNRLRSIIARLEKAGLVAQCARGHFESLTANEVKRVHRAEVVERAKRVAEEGGGYLDPDTVVCPESFNVALAAAGACVSAVDAVLSGPEKTALCLVRPPGHHATPTRSMGFCLFNNIALAAHHAITSAGLRHVLIVDWDVHHGNGTQDIFYQNPQVTFFSIHRYGGGFYPGTGAASETGSGPGLGHTFNAPVAFGISRAEYRDVFTTVLERAAEACKPELVLLSAGFDAHARDPLGRLGLEAEDFADMTKLVRQVANTHANGRVVSCLEGGYNLQALAESVEAHLEQLLAENP